MAVAYALSRMRCPSQHKRTHFVQRLHTGGWRGRAIGLLIGTAARSHFCSPSIVFRSRYLVRHISGRRPFRGHARGKRGAAACGSGARHWRGNPLLAPLLLPAAIMAGIDPFSWGHSCRQPHDSWIDAPLGILVYVSSGISGARPAQVFREVLPLLLALLVALAVLCIASACQHKQNVRGLKMEKRMARPITRRGFSGLLAAGIATP